MKTKYKHITRVAVVLLLALSIGISSCKKEEYSEDYDINWPTPVISEVSTYSDTLSSTISLKGEFTKVKSVQFGNVEGDNLQVASDGKSLTIDVPRTMSQFGAAIKVTNEYNKYAVTTEDFIPVIQETTVGKVSDIQAGLTFTIEGINVDLLTEIKVNGETATIVSVTINSITVSVAELDLVVGSLATVTFKSLALNNIPAVEKVNVTYLQILYNEIILWDFEDGTHNYTGEPTATVEDGTGMPDGGTKYFSLRAPGYSWDKATGTMAYGSVVDFASLTNPHITFAVRTPVGSAGYFELDIPGAWRHFGYGYDTGGEWVIFSEPLDENWEGDGWDPANFNPTLGFKAGNAGVNQDVDVAFVKITEGAYDGSQQVGDVLGGGTKPSKLDIATFEIEANWPDILNGSTIVGTWNSADAFIGNGSFKYIDDGTLGDWSNYWGSILEFDPSAMDFSVFDNPYLSFAVNTVNKTYIIIRFTQFGGELQLITKFFPSTSGNWVGQEVELFGNFENWSANPPYNTFARLSKDHPIEKIEVIIGRTDAGDFGSISLDDFVITEGPRY